MAGKHAGREGSKGAGRETRRQGGQGNGETQGSKVKWDLMSPVSIMMFC